MPVDNISCVIGLHMHLFNRNKLSIPFVGYAWCVFTVQYQNKPTAGHLVALKANISLLYVE